ncbi:hypothetical protein CoNPh26_CDS0097 [Staphylococcus phage S-CoN_Ph26]|nr:hypothetical protein CoNPh26_CDS0097 [Staphylococcus phage S-CoN_Ph26]
MYQSPLKRRHKSFCLNSLVESANIGFWHLNIKSYNYVYHYLTLSNIT